MEDVTRNYHGERHIDFSITTSGFCDQPQKIIPPPCETNRVSGLNNRYRGNDFGSFREKIKACVLNLTKLIDLLSSTAQAILPAQIQFKYLPLEQILALQKNGSYSGHVTQENLARQELLWWMENLKLCNGRKIQQ